MSILNVLGLASDIVEIESADRQIILINREAAKGCRWFHGKIKVPQCNKKELAKICEYLEHPNDPKWLQTPQVCPESDFNVKTPEEMESLWDLMEAANFLLGLDHPLTAQLCQWVAYRFRTDSPDQLRKLFQQEKVVEQKEKLVEQKVRHQYPEYFAFPKKKGDPCLYKFDQVLTERTDSLRCVAYSPDGKQVVSGWSDRAVQVWDIGTGQCVRVLKGNTGSVTSVAVSPDGKYVVSGDEGDDQAVRVWNVGTGECVRALHGHNWIVTSVAVSPDGKYVVSGSEDETVRVWDINKGKFVWILRGHIGGVRCVAYSPDGNHLVSGGSDQSVRVWDINNGKCVRVLKGHPNSITSVAVSPDGKHLVSGSYDQTVRVWDTGTGQCLSTLCGHTDVVIEVAYSPDGKYIVSTDLVGGVTVWDSSTYNQVWLGCFPSSCDIIRPSADICYQEGQKVYYGPIPFFSFLSILTGRLHQKGIGPLSDPKIWIKIAEYL